MLMVKWGSWVEQWFIIVWLESIELQFVIRFPVCRESCEHATYYVCMCYMYDILEPTPHQLIRLLITHSTNTCRCSKACTLASLSCIVSTWDTMLSFKQMPYLFTVICPIFIVYLCMEIDPGSMCQCVHEWHKSLSQQCEKGPYALV